MPLDTARGSLLVRVLVVTLASALGALVGLVAGLLDWIDGADPAGAVLTGGGAGAGALALALALASVLARGL
ncbi:MULTISPECIES: hypothetical protein [Parafrankia]|nr:MULTISPECIES: hypothetical protein [Parafrankia]